ncbi:MAG: hypothetical protein ABI451_03560 [Dokdonella sp.]
MKHTTMTRPEWPDDELIRKYLNGAVTPDEEARVELRLLDDPDFLGHMERELALRDGLAALSEPLAEPHRGATLMRVMPRRTSRRWQWAAAATFVLAIGLLAALATLKRSIDERNALAMRIAQLDMPVANVPIVPVSIMRGVSVATELPRSLTVLRVYLPETTTVVDPGKYRLTIIQDGSKQPAFDISDLVAMDDGSLSMTLNAGKLLPGRYVLIVNDQPPTGKAEVMRAVLSVL